MLIKFETENGNMSIVADAFFPATKKDLKKLKKAMVNPEDYKKVGEAIDSMISQINVYANDCKARAEIHEMCKKEELKGSFRYESEERKVDFYKLELDRANKTIRELNQNKEDL